MVSQSRKRSNPDEEQSERRKRPRVQHNKSSTSDHSSTETPFPSRGAKRKSTDLKDGKTKDAKQAIDAHAVYNADKAEIDEWYDLQYSRRLGIPDDQKRMHSKDKWFVKVDAWMEHKGIVQSPKKRKLDNKKPMIDEEEVDRRKRPDRTKYPEDTVPVPEYPFDKLADFVPMANGRYVCYHSNRNPPLDCCLNGLTRSAKKHSIRKGLDIWKARVEKLIDQGKLNYKHKTWENWAVQKLREKYQPELYRDLKAKKAEKLEQEREGQRKFLQAKADAEANIAAQEAARRVQKPSKQQQRPPPSPTTQVQKEPSVGHVSRPIAPIRVRSPAQASRAKQEPQPTRVATPEPPSPDHNLEIQAPTPHQNTTTSELPSREQDNQPSDGDSLDSLFGDTDTGVCNSPAENTDTAQQVDIPEETRPDSFLEETETIEGARVGEQSTPNVPSEIWDHERVDSGLERLLSTFPLQSSGSAPPTQSSAPQSPAPQSPVPHSPASQGSLSLRSENFYLASLSETFATDNSAVNGEMQNILEQVYQPSVSAWQHSPEDEALLQQTIEGSQADWQRYCDFFANEVDEEEQT
ncbi:hypothetical protein C7974DRAFT_458805 [Boeremia exigua]|uniref:uncharacterized protein n=1 Tax=Boeremia exigua TaxID=749465 RepID=UPI001E8D5A96|nr:uncharacterized protein C7974DRAFT_458805 [Boeremia exigua]KAH6620544.1 hypothetical protein C7974DRAFT_458805 [Boeremia exigua]